MKKLYMIGNTHFDPVWLWRWDEAMSSITATFKSALERMDEYPEFCYSFATPPVFEWIKKTNPELFEKIKEKVKEGRWELCEGWWVQPDCFSASGESYVRQGLFGQRYLEKNFGKRADTVFNIDSFGHSPVLPQILKKSGVDYYVMCRPEERHVKLEQPLFNWKSADGSEVLTYRDDAPYQYDTKATMEKAQNLPYDSMLVYGVTDHGGAPTKKSLDEIKENEWAECSTVAEFFKNRTTDYTVEGEFITGDFGPYANHPAIKAKNRVAEYAVLNAEKSSLIADNYDRETINSCWRDILFNQFHDILGGASIKDAYIDAENQYGRAEGTADEITHFNLLKVTNNIDLPGKNGENVWNLVVWNLNPHNFDGYVEAEVQWVHEHPWYDKEIVLEDADGVKYECQIIREKSVIPAFRSRFVFSAQIPSLGYKAFRVLQTGKDIAKKVCTLEEILAKIPENLLTPVCFCDDGDTWAFNIDSYGKMCELPILDKAEVIESGALRTTVKISYSFRSSKIWLYYTLYENESYIDVHYRVNWNEKHIVLKLMSDVGENAHVVAVPYGSTERGEVQADVPMGEWIRCKNHTFIADGIFSYNMVNEKLGLTLLRSAIYGDLRISEIDLDADYDILSQGITEGNIRVMTDGKNPEIMAQSFNNPPKVLCEANHSGTLPPKNSYFEIDADGIMVTVLKKCEDSNANLIRGVETQGKSHIANIMQNGDAYTLSVAPFEIFTAKIENKKITKTNMLEETE